MQSTFEMTRDVSRVSAMAEIYAQAARDIGPVTALFGWRIIAHAQRYGTLDGMDSFTREPSIVLYGGIAVGID